MPHLKAALMSAVIAYAVVVATGRVSVLRSLAGF